MAFQGFSTFFLSMLSRPSVRKTRYWWLSLLLWIVFIAPAQALELRVAVKDDVNQLKIGTSTEAVVTSSNGQTLGKIEGMRAYYAQANGGTIRVGDLQGGQIWIDPSEDGYIWIGDRWYRGRTLLIPQGNELLAVNYVDLEEYLYSVVGAEAVPSWPLEALKAQAVAARTYALHKRSKSTATHYDLDTTTATQVYKGLDTEYLSTHQAVKDTAGQIMTYNGQVILAVFHAASGGHTENAEDIWSSPLPYLRGVADYDQGTPAYQWSKSFSASELGRLVGGVGTVQSMTPERTTPRGRVVTMKIVGDRGTKRMSGTDLRNILGLRSTLFSVNGSGGNFQLYGKGFGHGVGLSQWGAYNLARQGYNYRHILSHYYQNAVISQLDSPGQLSRIAPTN